MSSPPSVVETPVDEGFRLTPTLKSSIRDGMCAATMLGIGETYLGVFGIFMRASAVQIGLLASLPQFIASLAQLFSVWALRYLKSRKQFVVISAFCNATIWIFIAALALFHDYYSSTTALIFLATLYHSSSGVGNPIWNSIMGDIVPPSYRGRFFGLRNRNVGFFTFLGMMLGGTVLELSKSSGFTAFGFFVIFFAAGISRYGSTYFLNRYEAPPHIYSPNEYFSLWQFIKRSPWSNFARFVYFISTINCAVAFAGPYFAVYMLDVMHLSYMEFTVITALQMMAQFLTMQYWGSLTDRFGNRIMNICGFMLGVNPFMWFLVSEVWHILLIQVFSGVLWAGFNLACANFIFDA